MAVKSRKLKPKTAAAGIAAANARVKAALDNVTANVMLADADLNIIYVNRTVETMMRTAEQDIRKDLPRFDVATLIGTNIDTFHRNPAHQRAMLARLDRTFESKLSLGGRTFRIIANPVHDEAGVRIGTVVEWTDLTEQLRREAEDRRRAESQARAAAENARIRTALDNVSGNVMLADADHNIVYMNKAVVAMLHAAAVDLRRELPHFDPDKLIGSSIERFHQQPSQQQMLAQMRGRLISELRIGARRLRIIANPVLDAQGVRIGTVVEWIDRTEELAVEEEVNAIVNAAQDGDLTGRIDTRGKLGAFATLSVGINGLLDNMMGVVRQIKAAAAEVHGG
ncbi:MAG TPA: PAS domain-containing protein, partial [Steroidobacteraceae bacterium]|nr:PAS domain-containing protein [Steroidobacteraceae bacterium]